jgi:hypothetical protein
VAVRQFRWEPRTAGAGRPRRSSTR